MATLFYEHEKGRVRILVLSDGIYQITDEIINAIKTCDISDYNATHVEIING